MLRRSLITLLACICLANFPALARDLPRNDPTRQALLDSARDEPDIRFVVRDMFRAGDFAYLCALKRTPDGIIGTDESLDVYQWIFIYHHDKWIPQMINGGLANSLKEVDCTQGISGDTRLPETEEDLRTLLRDYIREDILHDLQFGKPLHLPLALAAALHSHNVLQDFPIDQPKEPMVDVQISIPLDRCGKDDKCRATVRQDAAALARLSKDPQISSLLWENCKRYIRSFNLGDIVQCVNASRSNQNCRPGLYAFRNDKDIRQCVNDLLAQCKRQYTNTNDRLLVCGS